jgi:hypothetical protein
LSRGFLNFIRDNPVYAESNKNWYVELLSCTYTWFDAVIDPFEGFDVASMTRQYLKELREEVQNNLDKHFVYYLASRIKVRFNTKKKPRYGYLNKKLTFYIEIGRRRIQKKCTIELRDQETREVIQPKVVITDRYITIYNEVGGKSTISIYDFLNFFEIETGVNSEVQYVGYTKNPAERPLNRDHRGFGDMLHWTSRGDEDYDYFIFYNLFKVLSIGINPGAMFNFIVPNAMMDEVTVEDEGLILEKALIKYFDPKPQDLNKARETSELNNRLELLAKHHRIQSITFDLSMALPNELFRFYSRKIEPTDRHNFTCLVNQSGAQIVPAKSFDTGLA